jgi:hypothetical protein
MRRSAQLSRHVRPAPALKRSLPSGSRLCRESCESFHFKRKKGNTRAVVCNYGGQVRGVTSRQPVRHQHVKIRDWRNPAKYGSNVMLQFWRFKSLIAHSLCLGCGHAYVTRVKRTVSPFFVAAGQEFVTGDWGKPHAYLDLCCLGPRASGPTPRPRSPRATSVSSWFDYGSSTVVP